MKRGEKFQNDAFEYIKTEFSRNGVSFINHNSADSTCSDIEVLCNGKSLFFIECKDSSAQSGQFVLIPDSKAEKFIFSSRNRTVSNPVTESIIELMNKNFKEFVNAGTAGKEIDVDSHLFSKWIEEYYTSKNVRFFISRYNDRFIVFPTDRISDYFDISAKYRTKKSGSSVPSVKEIPGLSEAIFEADGNSTVFADIINGKKHLFVQTCRNCDRQTFEYNSNIYCFSKQDSSGLYEIRKLSSTRNMNVIFSVRAKKEQDSEDRKLFLKTLDTD